jgi:prevent-host-death family protein
MKKVGVAEFKAKLSEYLRAVRRGQDVTILDRGEPVARVVGVGRGSGLVVRERPSRTGRLADVPLPPPVKTSVDAVELLLEDRRKR